MPARSPASTRSGSSIGAGVSELPRRPGSAGGRRQRRGSICRAGVIMGGESRRRAAGHRLARRGRSARRVVEDVTHAWYKGRGAQQSLAGRDGPLLHRLPGRREVLVGQGPALRRASRCRWGRWRTCWSATRRRTPLTRKWTDDALGRVSKIAGRHGRRRPDAVHHGPLPRPRHPMRHARRAGARSTGSGSWTTSARATPRRYNHSLLPEGRRSKASDFTRRPRGTLSHWVVIKDGVLSNYQAVVPTTWNASPRDDEGVSRARTRPRSSGLRSPMPNSRWRCSGPCTPSTRAWPARATPSTHRAARSRR